MPRRLAVTLTLLLAVSSTHMRALPAAPANLQAVVNGTTVTLSWDAPAGAVAGYRVEAGSVPGASDLASMVVAAAGLTVPNVPPGTYFVRVRAIDAEGDGPPSNEVTVAVGLSGSCPGAPDPPQRLRATVNASQVSISWAPAETGCAATSYVLRAGSVLGAADIAQIPVQGTALGASAPDGYYFVSVVGVNAFGVSEPSGSIIIPVVVPFAGGRVEFNQSTVTLDAGPSGEAVIVGEVVNRSLVPAHFVEVTGTLRDAQGGAIAAHTTFLRGVSRRLNATGIIDDSALAPGEVGCFYIRSNTPLSAVANVAVQVANDTFASSPMAGRVELLDLDRVASPGNAIVSGGIANTGTVPTYFNAPVFSFKRADGRSIGCDFAFAGAMSATVPGGVTTDTVLVPGQSAAFVTTTHAPASAAVFYAWAQWQEVTGDPLAAQAAQTYDAMRHAPDTVEGEQQAVAAWEALQAERRTLARQVGQ